MYALHKTCEHDAWRKYLDESKSKAGHTTHKASTIPSTTPNINPFKKLSLSESICTALCNQAGLSSYADDGLWYNSCRDSVTIRSKPWVKFHINYSLFLILCRDPGSNDLINSFPNLQLLPITILIYNNI